MTEEMNENMDLVNLPGFSCHCRERDRTEVFQNTDQSARLQYWDYAAASCASSCKHLSTQLTTKCPA
ncbi:hypothetical protein T265_11638 [Opisthorchis viverrini]|uniref:Uncharacterized protein n=1 Tax=Opisthorchis viverrini TaxID=6198 RepID=A0A074YXX9_OPIVI|nr:hypothetical protein T265_11638 [Opisthorchis viverrini]KER19641.1 hypothetical protein T265_11638 [Opisthorchis viverrini]